jgi:tetratricopeptide (TPR) repeat protein
MNGQLNADLPKESDSQRIGRMAGKCFEANSPNAWASTATAGDCDFGYDYQVQVIDKGLAKDVFRMQLKGTEAPKLNANGSAYSVTIKISTANYYARATEPVLLVLCDLSIDPNIPKNCPLYFLWIQDELRKLREEATRDGQQSVTLHVPKANKLEDATDLSADIERYRTLSRIGYRLDTIVEGDKPKLGPSERAQIATKMVLNLNSKSAGLIDALAEDDQSSWVEAQPGSLQWHLRESMNALQGGRGADCRLALDEAAKLLDNARPLEKADYWNAIGRLHTFNLDEAGARDAFERACQLSGDTARHLIPWAEAELRTRFRIDGKADFTDVIARLNASAPAIVGMRARLVAAEGRFDAAITITESIDGVDRHIAQAIIFSMQGRWDNTLTECELGLTQTPLRAAAKQLFLILRARAKYSKAVGPIDFRGEAEVYLPAPGPAGTDVGLLRSAWTDIVEALTTLRAAGWPANVELLSDMWSSTATMLGLQDEAVPLMAEAAKARPSLRVLQAGLESMAAQAGKFDIALEANSRQPESPRSLQQRIAVLHIVKRHQECVSLLEAKWDIVADDSVPFGFALLQGIHSAEKIIQPAIEKRWRQKLASRPALAGHAALLDYFDTKLKKPLEKEEAFKALIDKYESLGRPTVVAKHLLSELDTATREQATLCVEVVDVVKATSMLDLDDLTQLAQALTTLRKWDDLLRLSREGLRQFEGNDRLRAIGAIALDKLGRTAEAHELLKSIVERPNADALALSIYIKIASRSGFTEQAIAAIEKILSGERNQAKRLECLRSLFALLHQTDPTSQRLVEIAWKIGEMVNQEDEVQEGTFLTTMFTATLPASSHLDQDRVAAFQRRLAAFIAKFPSSRILKCVSLPSDASGDDLIRMLEGIVGSDEQQRKNREKLQRELSLGIAPVPYAWRPRNILDSISDLPTLWEVSKRSSWDARHLHLVMATNDWKAMELRKLRGQVPLLDLLSLIVIADLDLFEALFKLFPRIAVGKATMMEIQQLLTPLGGSLYRNKLLSIQSALKSHFADIEQPEAAPPSEDHFDENHWASLEIVEIAKSGKYLVYSDDALFRIFSQQPSVCTLDLLCALDHAGELSAKEVATKIATLCSWRVALSITPRHQLAILPDALGTAKSIADGIQAMLADEHCTALFGGIWNIEKPFSDLQGHAGITLRNLADDSKNSITSVAALAGFWLGKVRLHKHAPTPADRLAALLIGQASYIEHSLTTEAARRLWSVYSDLIVDIHGHFMDDEKLWQSIRQLGAVAADADKQHSLSGDRSLRTRLAGGLNEGTREYDLFNNEYSSRLASLAKMDKQRGRPASYRRGFTRT